MLKLGIPSKGRLQDKTIDWFADRGVSVQRTGSEREYAGVVKGMDNIELVLLSAGEIPKELAAGRIHLGVTGTDLVREKMGDWQAIVDEVISHGSRVSPAYCHKISWVGASVPERSGCGGLSVDRQPRCDGRHSEKPYGRGDCRYHVNGGYAAGQRVADFDGWFDFAITSDRFCQ